MTLSKIALCIAISIATSITFQALVNVLTCLMIKIGDKRYRKEIMRLRDGMPRGQNSVINKNGERIFFVSKNNLSLERNPTC